MDINTEVTQKPTADSAIWTDRISNTTWLAIGVVLLVNSVLRGIRAPGRWAYTEMLFNYDFGFSKRGLVGAIISALHWPVLYHYSTCFWYSVIVFGINLILLTALLRRLLSVYDTATRLASLVFASSLAVVVLAHTIGYGDQVALLITLLALRIRNYYWLTLFSILFVPISILAHETNFVIFFPVILLRFLVELGRPIEPRKLAALCAVLICTAGAILLAGYTHTSQLDGGAMYKALQAKADYPLRKDEFYMITSTFGENIKGLVAAWHTDEFIHFFASCLIVTLPATVYLMYMFVAGTTGLKHSALLRLAGIAACVAPLSLGLVGGDLNRWTTLATTTSFLSFSIVRLQGDPAATYPITHPSKVTIPIFLIILNLGSSMPLFDGYIVQSFPYEEHVQDVVDMVTGRAPFPPPPEQCVESGCMVVIDGFASRSAVSIKQPASSRQ
jgi:hypothetical protein